nr:MAG TPA: hypothetical protein [Caudoviricetes sp.]
MKSIRFSKRPVKNRTISGVVGLVPTPMTMQFSKYLSSFTQILCSIGIVPFYHNLLKYIKNM